MGGSRGRPLTAIVGGEGHAGMVASMLGSAVGTWHCDVCADAFGSRNLLFLHIKQTGHAARKEDIEASERSQRKGGKKGRKGRGQGGEEEEER